MQFGKRNKASSRRQIRIKEVKDRILVLPGNKYRCILETSAINIELKSEDEQDALIDNFQNFLNSLPCKLQILIRVRELDIDKYLEQFTKVGSQQTNDYCEFIKDLVADNKILSRRFYVVISYDPKEHKSDFNLIKEQILLNEDIVIKGLEKLGMKTRTLDSLEILELFYSFYNPGSVKSQQLKEEVFKPLFEGNYAV